LISNINLDFDHSFFLHLEGIRCVYSRTWSCQSGGTRRLACSVDGSKCWTE